MRMFKNKGSIGNKIQFLVGMAAFSVSLVVAVLSYFINAGRINGYFSELSLNSARYIAASVDAKALLRLREVAESDEYQALRETAEEEENEQLIEDYFKKEGVWEDYLAAREILDQYLEKMNSVEYAYLIVWSGPNDRYDMYLVDDTSTPMYETGYYEEREEGLMGSDASKEIEPTISRGDWGWLCSSYVPIYTDDGILVCQAGCDVAMNDIMSERYQNLIFILLAAFVTTAFITAGLMLLIRKNLIRPLLSITNEMTRFSPAEDLDPERSGMINLDINSNDEIEDLYNGIRTMQSDIIDYLKDVVSAKQAEAVAQEASRAKSSFLANMSHEIRTPINAVLGMNEMILRESNEDATLTYASNIKTAGNSLLGIINDILDFSKIEAGKMEIIPVHYDISSMINDLVNMIQTRADAKGLTLIPEIAPDIPHMLCGDEIRIKQIITNLLTNAVKYTEKGSITFGMSFDRIANDPDSISLNVFIKDTGIGIKPEDMKKLFSEFDRIEEERNRNIEGTGLGINITKSLLEMMDSFLMVKSTYGSGSTFSFRLKQKVIKWDPIGDYGKTYRDSLTVRKKYKEKFTAPKAIVLMVDDNELNRVVFRSLIKKTLIQTELASDGNECLALSRKKKYDIIFLDHLMPGKDGIETLKELKEEKDNPNIDTPVICLTANAVSGAREQYTAAGFDDYLTKPIDTDALENMFIEYLPAELVKQPSDADSPMQGDTPDELALLKDQDQINISSGIANNGSIESYISALRIFYRSMDSNIDAINDFLSEGDYENYTIKIHALKSSLLIIGAKDIGKKAFDLETAGKNGDHDYIQKNHKILVDEYISLKEPLKKLFESSSTDKVSVDADFMYGIYTKISNAAEDMDFGKIEDILNEMSGYSIPENEIKTWDKIKELTDLCSYDEIVGLLKTYGSIVN